MESPVTPLLKVVLRMNDNELSFPKAYESIETCTNGVFFISVEKDLCPSFSDN